MTEVIAGNDVEQCIHLFNTICRKTGLVVCFDGSVGKIQIYQKSGSRYKVLKKQHRLFSIFDPDKDGRDYKTAARRWMEAADILSEQLKDRGIQIRILPNDQCIFARIVEKTFTPFGEVVELIVNGNITVEYGAEVLGMSEEAFRAALVQAGVVDGDPDSEAESS